MKRVLRAIFPLLALAAGIAVMVGFIASKPKAKKSHRFDPGTLVETTSAERSCLPPPARSEVASPDIIPTTRSAHIKREKSFM